MFWFYNKDIQFPNKNKNFPFISDDMRETNISIYTGNMSLFFSVIFEFTYVPKRKVLVGRMIA
jgi:uncharacterized protein YozE (UPF0346 family)